MKTNNNSSKQYFSVYFGQKQSMEKIPIFEKNHGLSPLQKFEFFHFFQKKNLLNKPFSSIKSISKQYFSAYFGQKPSVEKIQFFTKTMEKCQFFDFLNFLFL